MADLTGPERAVNIARAFREGAVALLVLLLTLGSLMAPGCVGDRLRDMGVAEASAGGVTVKLDEIEKQAEATAEAIASVAHVEEQSAEALDALEQAEVSGSPSQVQEARAQLEETTETARQARVALVDQAERQRTVLEQVQEQPLAERERERVDQSIRVLRRATRAPPGGGQ